MKGSCEVCKDNRAKYRCPGCGVQTCCLQCVHQHKRDTACSGQRDETAYVGMNQFKDIHLLNDYRFLEDGGRRLNNSVRDPLKNRTFKPHFLKDLEKKASQRKIDLKIMPYPMSRRKNNSTTYQYKIKSILWQIEWKFPQADVTITDKRVQETNNLDTVLRRHFSEEADPIVRHKLKSYYTADKEELAAFMAVGDKKQTAKRYYRLDLDKSLAENLEYKCVIEYPTIEVVLEPHWSNYITDLEEEQGPVLESMHKKRIEVQ